MNHNEEFDLYYESECNDASDQAMYEQQQEDYLNDLIRENNYLLYALEVSISWLTSEEFAKSNLSAVDFLSTKRDNFLSPKGSDEPF